MSGRPWVAGLVSACLVLALSACGSDTEVRDPTALGDDAITVASFDFPESRLLATLYGKAMEAGGYRVRYELDLGPREFVEPALARGLVEFVPEYAGTALNFLSIEGVTPSSEEDANHSALERILRGTDVAVLEPAPAQDANAFVVTRETSVRYRLRDLSSLRSVARRLTFGGPPECPTRPFCLAGLEQVYRVHFKSFISTDAGGPVTLQALRHGQIDAGLLFSSDPNLSDKRLVELRDDRELQPAENITPLVHREILRRWGSRLSRLIDGVSEKLTTPGLRELNRQVIINKRRPSAVASAWLRKEGIR